MENLDFRPPFSLYSPISPHPSSSLFPCLPLSLFLRWQISSFDQKFLPSFHLWTFQKVFSFLCLPFLFFLGFFSCVFSSSFFPLWIEEAFFGWVSVWRIWGHFLGGVNIIDIIFWGNYLGRNGWWCFIFHLFSFF